MLLHVELERPIGVHVTVDRRGERTEVLRCQTEPEYGPAMYSRHQLKRDGCLTAEDLVQIGRCRRPENRLGFGYQL